MCMDMCVDMCVEMPDPCACMRIDMCVDMREDMLDPLLSFAASHRARRMLTSIRWHARICLTMRTTGRTYIGHNYIGHVLDHAHDRQNLLAEFMCLGQDGV